MAMDYVHSAPETGSSRRASQVCTRFVRNLHEAQSNSIILGLRERDTVWELLVLSPQEAYAT